MVPLDRPMHVVNSPPPPAPTPVVAPPVPVDSPPPVLAPTEDHTKESINTTPTATMDAPTPVDEHYASPAPTVTPDPVAKPTPVPVSEPTREPIAELTTAQWACLWLQHIAFVAVAAVLPMVFTTAMKKFYCSWRRRAALLPSLPPRHRRRPTPREPSAPPARQQQVAATQPSISETPQWRRPCFVQREPPPPPRPGVDFVHHYWQWQRGLKPSMYEQLQTEHAVTIALVGGVSGKTCM